MEISTRKKSLVILAADLYTIDELVNLIETVGPYISALKTHVDMVIDFDKLKWEKVLKSAENHNCLLYTSDAADE